MRRTILIAATTVVATACRHEPGGDVKPLAPVEQQPGQMIDVSSMSATVLGVNDPRPRCPIRPHIEANLVVRGVSGVIQYRWERSDSTHGPLRQVVVPAHGDSVVRISLVPDEWADTTRGVQLAVDEQVRITYPFPVLSASTQVLAKCY